MKVYLELLSSSSILKRLSFIQLIVYFGAWFSNVAIYALLLDFGVSAEIIAFVAVLHFMSAVVQAPFSGVIIDKFPPKKIMLVLIVFEFFSTFLLIFIENIFDLWALYILISIKMAAASFYFTLEMSLLPKLLKGNNLQKANELHSIIWSFSYTIGMALGGFVVYLFGIKIAFLLDACMFLIAFLLLYNLKIDILVSNVSHKFIKMITETFIYLKQTPQIFHLMLVHAFVGLSAFDALVALMVKEYYSSLIAASLALGLIHASRALGLIFGPLLFSKYLKNIRIVYFFIFEAMALWIWAYVMENFYLSLLASVLVGLFITTLWSYTYTLLQVNSDEKYYGRIVAYNDMLFLSFAGLTSYMTGFLRSSGFSIEMITVFIGIGFVIASVYFLFIIKHYMIKEIL